MVESSLLTILPNLSIGVISIIGLVYIVVQYNRTSKESLKAFIGELDKRELNMRSVEKEFRAHMTQHINSSTQALIESTKVISTSNSVIERAILKLDTISR